MGGFRHRALHVEMKHRFRAAGAFLGQAPPAGIAHARRAVAGDAVAHEIDIDVILVGRPMALEIVEEASASRAAARAPRNSAAGRKSRGRCRPALARPRRAAPPAIRRCPCGSSICAGSAAAELPPEARRPRPDRRASPSGLRSAFPRPNSRCRWCGRKQASLLLNAANEHQKPLKFRVIAVSFPEVDELADHLEIADLIMSIAVDPIE